jgi:hypothetical protein
MMKAGRPVDLRLPAVPSPLCYDVASELGFNFCASGCHGEKVGTSQGFTAEQNKEIEFDQVEGWVSIVPSPGRG